MSGNFLVLKIAGGVVLGLLVWTSILRYQERRAIEQGLQELRRAAEDPDPLGWRAKAAESQASPPGRRVTNLAKPVPPGFRCVQGTLLKKADGGWTQVTDRHNEWYCPHGGTVDDCYRVSAQSTGCV